MVDATALADAAPPSRCTAAKERAAGKYAMDTLRCHARAVAGDDAVDPVCLARAEGRLTLGLARADRKGPCLGTAPAIETTIGSCAATIVSHTPDPERCSATKRTAAGALANRMLTCLATHAPNAAACLDLADRRFAAAFVHAGACQGTASQIESDVDMLCVADTEAIVRPPTPTTTSTTTTGPTTTSTSVPACCGPERMHLSSNSGTMKIGGLAPFPLPASVTTVLDLGPADATCTHDVIVPAGGFAMPAFCIPAFQWVGQVTTSGCAIGDGDGAGLAWDGHGGARGGTPRTSVTKSIDSSDGSCDTSGASCADRDLNTDGKIVTTSSPGGDPNKLGTRVDIPAHFRMWQDAQGCPGDGIYNPAEGDTLTWADWDFVLTLTTGVATGQFVDQNGDGCSFATGSAGFGAPSAWCSSSFRGPCSVTGNPPPGPCCELGQSATLVAAGATFGGMFPFYDVGFLASIPSTVSFCGPHTSAECVVTTDPCLN